MILNKIAQLEENHLNLNFKDKGLILEKARQISM